MLEPPSEYHGAFVAAGWQQARPRKRDPRISEDHPAQDLLASFGNLHIVPESESGLECGTSDFAFQFLSHRPKYVDEWATRLKVELVGVAVTDETYGQLWLADDGRFFITNDITDTFSFVGDDFPETVQNLMTGIWVKPLLRPESPAIEVYGQTLYRGDSRLYDWQN